MLQRKEEERGGGCHCADSSEALLIVLVKRRNSSWSHVCNEGVLCCNDSALSLSSASTMIWQFSDPDFLFEKSVYAVIPPGHWWPIIPIVHWAVIRRPDVRITIIITMSRSWAPPGGCHPVDDGVEELHWAQDARLLPGAGPGLSDYVLQSYKSVGTPSVLRPCHTSLPLPPPLSSDSV